MISMKPLLSRALRLTVCCLLCSLSPGQAQEQQGVLWEIIPESGTTSYLFGTIHSEDPRVVELPEPVQETFDQAKIFCAEMKLDSATRLRMSQAMLYLDGQRLNDKLDSELYEKTVSLISQYGIPEQMVPMFKPWAAGLLLSFPRPETGMFLDHVLYQAAEQQNKALCGLENPDDVANLFDRTPLKTQINLLRIAVREHHNLDEMIEKLLQFYLAGDLDGLREYSDKELEKSDEDLSLLVNDGLIEKRNRTMLGNMQPHLQKGNAFIAVGALHLPGDIGLLHMLEEQGYRVKAVY